MPYVRNVVFALIFLFVSSNIFGMSLSDEKALISDVANTKAQYGEGSDEHVIAYAKLIDNFLKNSQKRDLAKSSLADFYQILKTRYGANAQILDEPAAKLGEMYLSDGEYLAAIPVLEDYLNNLNLDVNKNMNEQKPLPIPHQLGLVQYNLIRAYIETERYKDADNIFKDIVRDNDLRNDAESEIKNVDLLARTYEIAAEIQAKQFNWDKGLEYANKSLEITKQNHQLPTSDLVRRTNVVATFLKQSNKIEEAQAYEVEIKRISTREHLSDDMPASEIVALAQSYAAINQIEKAIEAYKLAEKKLLAAPIPNEQLLSTVYTDLTLIYFQKTNELAKSNFRVGGGIGGALALGAIITDANEYARKNLNLKVNHYPSGHKLVRSSALLLAAIQFLSVTDEKDAKRVIPNLFLSLQGADSNTENMSLDSFAEMLLSITYAYLREDDLSILWGKEAVNTLQAIKEQQNPVALALHSAMPAWSRQTYEIVSTLLIRQGRVLEAQQILQMLKENELYESMRSAQDDPRKLRADRTDFERKKFAKFYQLRTQQVALIEERTALEGKKERIAISKTDNNRLIEINDNLFPKLAIEMSQYLKQLEVDLAENPSKAVQNSTSISKEATNLSKVVNQIAKTEPSAHAVGVQYYVTESALNIIITTPNAPPIAHQVKLDRATLYENIKIVSLQMQNPSADPKLYTPALNKLYSLLITPIDQDLKRLGAKTLMLSLDDQLRLLPFAALQSNDNRYLLQDYTLALYNEAAYQALEKPSAKNWRIAAMGLSQSVDGLPALTAVPDELSGIVKNNGVAGDRYLDAQFTRNQFMRVLNTLEINPYNVLHIASHFELKPGDPSKSSL